MRLICGIGGAHRTKTKTMQNKQAAADMIWECYVSHAAARNTAQRGMLFGKSRSILQKIKNAT